MCSVLQQLSRLGHSEHHWYHQFPGNYFEAKPSKTDITMFVSGPVVNTEKVKFPRYPVAVIEVDMGTIPMKKFQTLGYCSNMMILLDPQSSQFLLGITII